MLSYDETPYAPRRGLPTILGFAGEPLESAGGQVQQMSITNAEHPHECPDPLGGPTRSKRPLLLVDVDGVISLFGFDHSAPPSGHWQMVDGVAHYLSGTAAVHLRRLSGAFELIWCTGWEDKANEYLPHALGLEHHLPHVSFADATPSIDGHWKLAAIDRYAGPDRPLAWVDDAHDERCRAWARARRGPTLLITTDPATGLTDAHADQLLEWALERLPQPAPLA